MHKCTKTPNLQIDRFGRSTWASDGQTCNKGHQSKYVIVTFACVRNHWKSKWEKSACFRWSRWLCENVEESIGINAALAHFNKVILDLKRKNTSSYRHSSRLAEFLQPILKQTKPIVYYHISPLNVSKYLNLVDKLMDVRVLKRPQENQLKNIPKKINTLR